jgi:RHS repeat-associated protein
MIEKSITWTGLARCAALRVIKVVGADRTWYLFAGGQVVSEFEDAASNNYSSGTMPGQAGSDSVWTQLYQHSDHLTTRVTTENDADVSNQQGHYPYGELWYSTGTADASVLRKFTSYEKDAEVAAGQLHYAVFRTHGARIGRFLRPDPVRGRISNPQRLNRYAYVTGNPIRFTDGLGLDMQDTAMAGPTGHGEPPLLMYGMALNNRSGFDSVDGGGWGWDALTPGEAWQQQQQSYSDWVNHIPVGDTDSTDDGQSSSGTAAGSGGACSSNPSCTLQSGRRISSQFIGAVGLTRLEDCRKITSVDTPLSTVCTCEWDCTETRQEIESRKETWEYTYRCTFLWIFPYTCTEQRTISTRTHSYYYTPGVRVSNTGVRQPNGGCACPPPRR